MDHGLELLSPILEIVDRTIHISVLSWKYWIVRSILRAASVASAALQAFVDLANVIIFLSQLAHSTH